MKTFTQNLAHPLILAIALLACSYTSGVFAADGQSFSMETVQSDDGFITRQPSISDHQLRDALGETRRYLDDKSRQLQQSADEHRKAGNNTLLAAIMPGGLLYLAYHKTRLSTAEEQLQTVALVQQEMRMDFARLALQAPSTIQVASFP